jgi:NAD+ synthase (glutamine-hydrolysing)
MNRAIYNGAAIIQDGKLLGSYRKHFLPNYGLFDENRYFGRGDSNPVFDFAGMLATRAADNVAIVAYCNLVGGQDELLDKVPMPRRRIF